MAQNSVEKVSESAKAESVSDENVEESIATKSEEEMHAEGYTTDYGTYTSTVAWCKNGDMNIYGEFYFPADYEEGKTYPVVIMSHGAGATYAIYEKKGGWVEYYTSQGYIAYAYDFCGGSLKSLSDGDIETYMTPSTEVSDLKTVFEFVKGQSFTDTEHMLLMGQSFGGLVSSLAATELNEQVEGIVLMYPAWCVPDMMREQYPTEADLPTENVDYLGTKHPVEYIQDLYNMNLAETLPQYTGKVLVIHGEADKTTPISYSEEIVNTVYAEGQAELVTITGKKSTHGFEAIYDEGRAQAQEAVSTFLSGLQAE